MHCSEQGREDSWFILDHHGNHRSGQKEHRGRYGVPNPALGITEVREEGGAMGYGCCLDFTELCSDPGRSESDAGGAGVDPGLEVTPSLSLRVLDQVGSPFPERGRWPSGG